MVGQAVSTMSQWAMLVVGPVTSAVGGLIKETSQHQLARMLCSIQPLSTWGSATGGSGFGQFEAQTGGNIDRSAGSNSSNKGAVGIGSWP